MTPRSRYSNDARDYPPAPAEEEELEFGEPIPEEEERPVAKKIPRARPVAKPRDEESDRDDRSEQPQAPGGRMVLSTAKYLTKNRDPEIAETNRRRRENERAMRNGGGGSLAPERNIVNSGFAGGILAMVVAVVWFIVGLEAGWVFFYPPILFVLGLVAFFKGLAKGK